ncbi:MAG: c-type cytochrome [Bryobacteraceae bacterium]
MRIFILPMALFLTSAALTAQRLEDGAQIFRSACSGCHGATGGGGRGPNIRDGRLVRRMSREQLFDSIKTGVPGTDMPAFPIGDEKIHAVVAFVKSLSAPAIEANVPGDEAAGNAIFFGKGGCSGCHSIRGRGGLLGPDLSNAGSQRSIGQLRESVLEPSARPTEGFQGVDVVMKTGERISGAAKNYTNYSIQILDRNGQLHLLDKKDVREITLHQKSLMPGDYSARLSETELQDLMAYLSRQGMRTERRTK